MPPRRTIVSVFLFLIALHVYIGMRLIPAMQPGLLGVLPVGGLGDAVEHI